MPVVTIENIGSIKKKKRRVIDPSTVQAPDDYVVPVPTDFSGDVAVSLDLETNDPHLRERGPGVRTGAFIVGVALRISGSDASYFPLAHRRGPNVDRPADFMRWLKQQARDFRGELRGSNLMYDLDFLNHQGITFPNAKIFDTQLAEPLIDENQFKFGLDALGKKYLGVGKLPDLVDLYGPGCMSRMADLHSAHVASYAERDCDLSWRVADAQREVLASEGLTELFDMECRLPPLLVQMRATGIRVDLPAARGVHKALIESARTAQDRLNQIVGHQVDVWSSDSLAKAFDELHVTYPLTEADRKKPPKKEHVPKPSFKKKWLEAHTHPVAKQILAVRHGEKLAGTFVGGYILDGNVNGRLHCTFNQLKADDSGTVTGRLSSQDPNLQNIPTRSDEGQLIRSLFIAEMDHDLGSADYSQIEPRLLAHYAYRTRIAGRALPGAAEMVEEYRTNPKADFHAMASRITGKDRKIAKSILLGKIYGSGVARMADELGLPYHEAFTISKEFDDKLPFLSQMSEFCTRRARTKGEIVTWMKRRRRLKDRHYRALNCLCQGTAADIMKKAMVDCLGAGIFNALVPHLTVHDELVVSVPRTPAGKEAFAEMCRLMENTVKLEVPLFVEGNLGANWRDAHG